MMIKKQKFLLLAVETLVSIFAQILNRSELEISERMYEEGYHYITNADYSPVCIEEMRERNAHLDEMDYVEMDLTEPLDILDSESFTCIVDKGTLDCVACSD